MAYNWKANQTGANQSCSCYLYTPNLRKSRWDCHYVNSTLARFESCANGQWWKPRQRIRQRSSRCFRQPLGHIIALSSSVNSIKHLKPSTIASQLSLIVIFWPEVLLIDDRELIRSDQLEIRTNPKIRTLIAEEGQHDICGGDTVA